MRAFALRVFALGLLAQSLARAQPSSYDVIIYGGTSAGVIAAAEAAQAGRSTLLISPTQHVGGMTASGLGTTDVGDPATIGGSARDFYSYVAQYYGPTPSVDRPALPAQTPRLLGADSGNLPTNFGSIYVLQFQFEPHAAEGVFTAMLRGAGARWVTGEQLVRPAGVTRNGKQIAAIRMKSGRTYYGRVFIDATYEGDLMAAAGVSYRVGREALSEFGESLAGVQRDLDLTGEVDPFRVPEHPESGVLPGVQATAPGVDGTGDNQVQQYNLRLCMTNVPENRLPLAQPSTYDRSNYELLARRLQQHPDWPLSEVCKVQPLPGGKADINANGSFSTDKAGDDSSRWVEADDAGRAAIQAGYRDYTQGLFWFLTHDPIVPRGIAQEAASWGLAKDEFADNDNWPWQLYVREARRMVGSYLMTQHNCDGEVSVPDPIALGSYALDSHKVTLFIDEHGLLNTEGFFYKAASPYPISYRSIVPRATECTNLLVPICVSASHVAFNSLRMEPVFMMLGHAAGAAACLALDQRTTVQAINYGTLARRLKSEGQILAWPNLPGEDLPPVTVIPPSPGKLEP